MRRRERLLKISMAGQSYKMGAPQSGTFRSGIAPGHPAWRQIQLDLFIPEGQRRDPEFGFSFQQAGVRGPWLAAGPVNGRDGSTGYSNDRATDRFQPRSECQCGKSHTGRIIWCCDFPTRPPAGVTVTGPIGILSRRRNLKGFFHQRSGLGPRVHHRGFRGGQCNRRGTRSLKTISTAGDFKWGPTPTD